MSNVVALRPRSKAPAVMSEAFLSAWATLPDTARIRSSRKQSWPEWIVAAREVGDEALLVAVRRYVSEDKEHKRECGAPGFHRWLKWGRYENWLGAPAGALISLGVRFPNETIRAQVAAEAGEAFCISYLDRCTMEGTVLIVPGETAVKRLRERAQIFKSLGFTGMRKSKP